MPYKLVLHTCCVTWQLLSLSTKEKTSIEKFIKVIQQEHYSYKNPWVSLKVTKSRDKDEKERSQWGIPAKRFSSDGWSNDHGGGADCKGKRNRLLRLPGSVDNLAPIFTATRQCLDLFTSEEQELLSDVEPIMRTLRKIKHLPGYHDGEPISDDDKTFLLEKILNFHPERE